MDIVLGVVEQASEGATDLLLHERPVLPGDLCVEADLEQAAVGLEPFVVRLEHDGVSHSHPKAARVKTQVVTNTKKLDTHRSPAMVRWGREE